MSSRSVLPSPLRTTELLSDVSLPFVSRPSPTSKRPLLSWPSMQPTSNRPPRRPSCGPRPTSARTSSTSDRSSSTTRARATSFRRRESTTRMRRSRPRLIDWRRSWRPSGRAMRRSWGECPIVPVRPARRLLTDPLFLADARKLLTGIRRRARKRVSDLPLRPVF